MSELITKDDKDELEIGAVLYTLPTRRVAYTHNLTEAIFEPNTTPSMTGLDVNLYYQELYGTRGRSNRGFPSHPTEDDEYDRLDEEDRKKMMRSQDVE